MKDENTENELNKIVRLHSIRASTTEYRDLLANAEEVIRILSNQRLASLGIDKVEREWLGLALLHSVVEFSGSDILVAWGDQRPEDIQLHDDIMRRRSAIDIWYSNRLERWHQLGYDPLSIDPPESGTT